MSINVPIYKIMKTIKDAAFVLLTIQNYAVNWK